MCTLKERILVDKRRGGEACVGGAKLGSLESRIHDRQVTFPDECAPRWHAFGVYARASQARKYGPLYSEGV